MTLSDLSNSMKPWIIHEENVYYVMAEFLDQGDMEKQAGLKPLKMMDRDYWDELPDIQVRCMATYLSVVKVKRMWINFSKLI